MIRNWINRLFPTSTGENRTSRASIRPRFRPNLLELEERAVLATLFVDPTIVGNPGDTVSFNQGRPGQVNGLVLGTNAFQGLTAAVTAAAAGDTLQLAQASITTDTGLTINKTLKIVGSGVLQTIVFPNADTATDTGITGAWFSIVGGATVDFSNMTFDGASSLFGIGTGVRYTNSRGTIANSRFLNISRNVTGNPFEGYGVVAADSTVIVTGNTFGNMGRGGALFGNPNTDGTFSNNSYFGKGAGDNLDIAVEAISGASLLVTGNTITNNLGIVVADGSNSVGIQVSDPGTQVTAIGNSITNSQIGVSVGFNPNDTPSVTLSNNVISGNVTGMVTDVAQGSNVNAVNNFWGNFTGPDVPGNPAGTGDDILDFGTGATAFGNWLRATTPVAAASTPQQYIQIITDPSIYAIGAGAGGGPHVKVFRQGQLVASFFAFPAGFSGGVRVATGDVDGDGRVEVIVAAGLGGGPHVKVFDALTGQLERSFFAYTPIFTGGVFLAVGDVNGDGVKDIITGAGPNGGPHVQAFDGRTGGVLSSFFAYSAGFVGGVTVAAGDFNGDFIDEIVTGAFSGGSSHVRIWNGRTNQPVGGFFAFDASVLSGIYVGAGDVTGDGIADILVGSNVGGPGVIRVFNSAGTILRELSALNPGSLTGTRVSGIDFNGDGRDLVFLGSGPTQLSQIQGIDIANNDFLNINANPFGAVIPGGIFIG